MGVFGKNRKERKPFREALRNLSLVGRPNSPRTRKIDWAITDRARLASEIASVAQNGQVGILEVGADCDWTYFNRARVQPVKSLFVMWREHVRAYDAAENRYDRYFISPEEADKHVDESRDLALEAYEDGHPHLITWP
jgi:hypothetical protein